MIPDRPVVVPYRPGWPVRAGRLIASLAEELGPAAVRIQHIGSTAVPGMPAKDVIDLQVSVTAVEDAARSFDRPLGSLGFRRLPYERDHVPAGRPDDPAGWAKRLWARRGHADGDVNLHVRALGAPNERLALLFRDWFCAHPEAVPAYGRFKVALAGAVPDLDHYTDVKDPVVDLVIAVAEQCAAASGWRP